MYNNPVMQTVPLFEMQPYRFVVRVSRTNTKVEVDMTAVPQDFLNIDLIHVIARSVLLALCAQFGDELI